MVDGLLRGDSASGFAECGFDPANGGEAFRPGEDLLHVEPALVPCDEARGKGKAGQEREWSPVGHPDGAEERLPAGAQDV